ncbi:MAG TPA: Glu/Leu/Phe/Val dehydrogenase dimerization domain-containing protein [Gammaproteobacteria bacterium]|jgi:leucine dehydrogenase|nr:Glu/Leu/Phe/Val dehydrogenase dimerization domain-containing protein [Gammaproteobacteria bacterium]
MEVFATLEKMGHEEVVFFQHKESGLKAIVAIHNTTLGPALGGLRMWPYKNEEEAITDVLRLSRGMTYKAAVSGLNLGGGKAVIIGDPSQKSEALFRALGRFVQSLGGRYITAEDVNTSIADMDYIFMETDYVTGVHPVHGGSGDPSPFTAFGVIQGIKACLQNKYGHTDLGKSSYAVQGLGHVGFHVVKHLCDAGAKVFVTDMHKDRVEECVKLGAEAVAMDDIYKVDAKVYVPCALGASVNEKTIPQFKFEIVAGAANNQLANDECGDELHKKGILYAPDYAINAGGLMNVSIELQGYDRERANRMVSGIYDIMGNIFKVAERDKIPTYKAADRLAEERIAAIGRVKLPTVKQSYERYFSGRKNGHH